MLLGVQGALRINRTETPPIQGVLHTRLADWSSALPLPLVGRCGVGSALSPVGRNHTSRNGAMRAKSSIDTGNADVDRHHARPFTALVVLALPPLWGPALTVPNEPPPLVLEFGQELEFG